MKDVIVCSGNMVNIDGVPEEVKLLPLGMVHSQRGDFLVDDESVESIIQYFKDRRIDLVIDYEHQTLKDIQAPAGGWITDIYKGEDALFAKAKWTEKASEYLKNKEYRYLSPVVIVGKKDKRAREIHSVALTNTPAIDGMFALVNSVDINESNENKEESKMDLKELAKLLGLPETATEEDVKKVLEAAAKVLKEKKEEPPKKTEPEEKEANENDDELVANSIVLSLLGLKTGAKTEDAAAAIMALKAGTDTQELKQELEKRNAENLVQMALKEGKITAAQKQWAETYALSDKEGFMAFMNKAPVVVPKGKMELKDNPRESKVDYDITILKNCGLTEEDVKKYYKED